MRSPHHPKRHASSASALALLLLFVPSCRTRLPSDDTVTPPPDFSPSHPLPDCAGLQSASPWPMYRGNSRHTGRSAQRGPRDAHVKWTLTLPDSSGSVGGWNTSGVIGPDGTIYVGSREGSLFAVDPDGSVKWRFPAPGPTLGTPAVDNRGVVYFLSGDAAMHAVTTATGTERWRVDHVALQGIALSNDGSIYAAASAFDAATGARRWTVPTGNGADSVPALGDDCTVYIAADRVYAVDHGDGSVNWVSEDVGWAGGNSPLVADDGTVFVGGGNSALMALDGATGKTLWKRDTMRQIRADPAIGWDGTIYFSSELNDQISALDPKTGAARWSMKPSNFGFASSPVVDAADVLYVGTNSYVRLFALWARTGMEFFSAAIPADAWRSPFIGTDGTLYFWTGSVLTALGP